MSKNFRTLFLVISGIVFLGTLAACYQTWNSINARYRLQNEYTLKIISRALAGYLKQADLVASSVVLHGKLTEDALERLAEIDESVAKITFHVHDANGRIEEVVPEEAGAQVIDQNLLPVNQGVKFGRTFYDEDLQGYFFPLLKNIVSPAGTHLGQIALTIDINKLVLTDKVVWEQAESISVIRAQDFYPQIMMQKGQHLGGFYQRSIDDKVRQNFVDTIQQQYARGFSELKSSGQPLTFINASQADGQKHIVSLLYLPEYQLWIGVSTLYSDMLLEVFRAILILFLAFTVIAFLTAFGLRRISQLEAAKAYDLKKQAEQDVLTELPSRKFMLSRQGDWFAENEDPFFLVSVDINSFKHVNDSHGLQFGDRVLKQFSQRLSLIAPLGADVMRHGGDEFLVRLPVSDQSEVQQWVDHLLTAMAAPFNVGSKAIELGISVGIASFPTDAINLDGLLRASDMARQDSKTEPHSALFFNKSMFQHHQHRLLIEQQMRQGIANKEFYVVYQPQVSSDNRLHGVEALVRWENESLGFVPPDKFIPIAESAGLMPKLGKVILDSAIREVAEVKAETGCGFHLALNISVRQLLSSEFFDELTSSLQASQMNPEAIIIEITESLFIEDLNKVLPLLERLKSLGMQVSMDDFGTGYSSLSLLSALPIDELKVDKSFVDNILADVAARKMIQNIISIGKNYRMHVLAEGVETLDQAKLLAEYGCDRFQGYLFSKPLRKHDLMGFVRQMNSGSVESTATDEALFA